ncbi:MAG: glycerol-3-phosphate 1-O-acyltransferase PlsY [Hyphomicrobiaceae bacterium]
MTAEGILLSAVVGYALGSIPSGLILGHLAGMGDIRRIGSGNIGATNVLRTGNKLLAAATLLCDLGKGALAVGMTPLIIGTPPDAFAGRDIAMVAGLAAFLGHLFPIWLSFQGGKGVATYIGVVAGLLWPLAIGFCIVWLVTAALTRYSSLAALVAAVATPVAAAATTDWGMTGFLFCMSSLLILRHRENIRRLLDGEESRIGEKPPEQCA